MPRAVDEWAWRKRIERKPDDNRMPVAAQKWRVRVPMFLGCFWSRAKLCGDLAKKEPHLLEFSPKRFT